MTVEVATILEAARRHQITLEVSGDTIKMRAPKKPPDDLIEQIKILKPAIIRLLTMRRYCAFTFVLDGGKTINAIRPGGFTLSEMQHHLNDKYGADRVSDLRGCA
ncbi:MAG: hypothetical protein HPY82_08365 [Gammaproteobacteria bacterium]|nr:hypothetical protein [Gammaproteobacteria bacterium]